MSRYRAPVPQTVEGATRIFAADVAELVRSERAVLIDVMAAEGAGPDAASGAWQLTKEHKTIPGAVWLPDVGRGRLDDDLERYFRTNLETLTHGDKARAIVIFCQADCWMSWNAVKRAASWGYTKLYWLSEGVDGWSDWDGELVKADPVPLTKSSRSHSGTSSLPADRRERP